MRADGLAALDNRSREIFRRVVDSYLETGEPVGSRNVSRILATALSPASVRNIMADLEDMGLIYAPHTSAGRLPTELGLRFFIDSLMEVATCRRRSAAHRPGGQTSGGGQSVESLLRRPVTCSLALARRAGVVLAAKQDVR
jgi:heat-inducible transcriptional repressor